MKKNVPKYPIEILKKLRWDTSRHRIISLGNSVLQIQKLDGEFIHLSHPTVSPYNFSIAPRNLSIQVIEKTNISPQLEKDILSFVSEGNLGGFIPFRSSIVPPINISRGTTFTHHLLPGKYIIASGVGIFTKDVNGNNDILSKPHSSITVRQYALKQNLFSSMRTFILSPEGCACKRDNDALLGAYRLGCLDELKEPANGVETLFRKTDQTRKLEKGSKYVFVTPHIIMYGKYQTIPDSGWLFYTLPETLSPLNLYTLAKDVNEIVGQKQYIYELYAYQFLQTLNMVHSSSGIPTFHGQPHLGNWHAVIDQSIRPTIAITDWGTSVDLSVYSRKRYNTGPSMYESMSALDFSVATNAIVSALYTDTERYTLEVIDRMGILIAYCFAGYFHRFNSNYVIELSKHFFSIEMYKKIQKHKELGLARSNPIEEFNSMMKIFLPKIFYYFTHM